MVSPVFIRIYLDMSNKKGMRVRPIILGMLTAMLLVLAAPLQGFAATPTAITCTPMATFNSNTALRGRVVCPVSVIMSDGSRYTGPINLSGPNQSDFSVLGNIAVLLATSLSSGSYNLTLTAGLVSTSLTVSVAPLGQYPTGLSCLPQLHLTTATALPDTVVCPIAVMTSNGLPFTGTLSMGNQGNSSYFAISSTTAPANLLITTPITLSGTYTAQVVAQTSFGSFAVTLSITVNSPIIGKSVTHLYNNERTDWNSSETTLNTTNVTTSFGLLNSVGLDEQVDAQPLVITNSSGHDEVFVATENNTVYRIDATTGTILQNCNLGTPVPMSSLPGSCSNNSAVVGITSTPVIDTASQTLYVMTYTLENSFQVYRIHALDLETLADKIGSGVIVTASGVLSDGTTYTFNPAVSRQRSALLEANGNIYAGFASFCDLSPSLSRGWLLGWDAASLTPLAANKLVNQLAQSPYNFFLSSIWMSGAGPAADENGNVFFVTGNSDPAGSYDAVLNLSESVVEMSPDLSTVVGVFTPSEASSLDYFDGDLGSGGVLIVPQQPALPLPSLMLSVGKSGDYYLLNRGSSFAGPSNPGKLAQSFNAGYGAWNGCWCANSYFVGADGVPRLVTSLSNRLTTFKLQASGSSVTMNLENMQYLTTGQDPGFFTSVSSNGTSPGSAVIWAVTRPTASPFAVNLVAFDNPDNKIIYKSSGTEAGTWPNTNGNANLVPVVADGRVFVGSYKNLAIFGLGGSP